MYIYIGHTAKRRCIEEGPKLPCAHPKRIIDPRTHRLGYIHFDGMGYRIANPVSLVSLFQKPQAERIPQPIRDAL